MTLLYDLRATQSAIKGAEGGGEYSRAVFRRLVKVAIKSAPNDDDPKCRNLAGFMHTDYPLDPEIEELVQVNKIATHRVGSDQELQSLLAKREFTTFMSGLPYQFHALDFGDMSVFLATHGARPLEQRMLFHGRHYAHGLPAKLKWLAKYLLETARPDWRRGQFQSLLDLPCGQLNLLVPSWHTLYSLIEKLNISKRVQFHNFYCPETAAGKICQPDMGVLAKLGVKQGRYLFMVSGDRWIKNTWRGLKALTEVMDKLPDDKWLPVVVTGGIPTGLPRGKRQYVIPTDYLTAEELTAMYRGARAFFYPTLNEGFGYPPLEAMAQNTPVVCSAVSSITEIVGDAAIYFNPSSLDEMKIRLRLAVEDDDLLAEYVERGQRRLAEVRARQDTDLDTLCDLLLNNATRG